MRVLFDYQAFSMQRYGGVSNSFVQLISNLPNDIEPIIGLRYTENQHLLNSKLHFEQVSWVLKPEHYPMKNGYYRFSHLFPFIPTLINTTLCYSKKLIKKGDYDILHATFFNPYFLKHNKKPYIITIHDMTPEIFHFEEKQIKGKQMLASGAAHIIAVSECTKKDIIKFLNIPEEKISVIYHGYEPNEIDKTMPSLIEYPYLLYVGARWNQYKGFEYFLRQSAPFINEHPEFRIVCTGLPFEEEEEALIQSLGIKENVIQMFCSTEQLTQLYIHAFAFIYPSLYEGFGIPILDAFHAGCPVLLNNKSCFPEVAQDGALYFDSEDENNTLLSKLKLLYKMTDAERNVLILKGQKRLTFFSWQKAAKELASVYQKIIG